MIVHTIQNKGQGRKAPHTHRHSTRYTIRQRTPTNRVRPNVSNYGIMRYRLAKTCHIIKLYILIYNYDILGNNAIYRPYQAITYQKAIIYTRLTPSSTIPNPNTSGRTKNLKNPDIVWISLFYRQYITIYAIYHTIVNII